MCDEVLDEVRKFKKCISYKLCEKSENPFRYPDNQPNIQEENAGNSHAWSLFCLPGFEFSENSGGDWNSRNMPCRSRLIQLDSALHQQKDRKEKRESAIFLSLMLDHFNMPSDQIEPIFLSVFLFDPSEGRVVSEPWEFAINSPSPATFYLDSQNQNAMLFVLISHPISKNFSSDIIQYYLDPTPSNRKLATSILSESYPRLQNVNSLFALTFAELSKIGSLPKPYVFNGSLSDLEICSCIVKAPKSQQLPFDIGFKKCESSNLIIRLLPPFQMEPFTYPIHQLIVVLKEVILSPKVKKPAQNILVEISFFSSLHNCIQCIRCKQNQLSLTKCEASKVTYHMQNASFDDIFVFYLPYPTNNASFLYFEVSHVFVQNSKEAKKQIGFAIFPLFENDSFVGDLEFTVPVQTPKDNQSADSSSFIKFSTYLRSNLISNDRGFVRYSQLNSDISAISDVEVVHQLYIILDLMIERSETTDLIQSFQSLSAVARKRLKPEVLRDFLMTFSKHYAFRNQVNSIFEMKDFARRFLDAWCKGISSSTDETILFGDFFFSLLEKSISTYKNMSFKKNIVAFAELFSSIIRNSSQHKEELSSSLGQFVYIIYDIGYPSSSFSIISSLLFNQFELEFVQEAFRPDLFKYFLIFSEKFNDLLHSLLKNAFQSQSKKCHPLFLFLVRTIDQYGDKDRRSIATKISDSLIDFRESQINCIEDFVPEVVFLMFVLANSSKTFSNFYKIGGFILDMFQMKPHFDPKDSRPVSLIFEPTDANSNLGKAPINIPSLNSFSPDSILEIQSNILLFIDSACRSCEDPEGLFSLFVRLVFSPLSPMLYKFAIPTFSSIIKSNFSILISSHSTDLIRLFRLLFVVAKDLRLRLPIASLVSSDHGNRETSGLLCVRVFSLLSKDEICSKGLSDAFCLDIDDSLSNISKIFQKIQKNSVDLSGSVLSADAQVSLLFERASLFSKAPDIQLEIIKDIHRIQLGRSKYYEAAMALLYESILVLLYLSTKNVIMPEILKSVIDSQYLKTRPFSVSFDPELIPDSLNSTYFNCAFLEQCLIEFMRICSSNHFVDLSKLSIDILWPILENFHSFQGLSKLFSECSLVYSSLNGISPNSEVLDERFFKVGFIGAVFGSDAGKSFIYHEKPLTHLFEFSPRIVSEYATLYPRVEIKLLEDPTKPADAEKGYITVSTVDPKQKSGKTFDTFYFDSPFVPGGGRLQGNVDTQWIRRTYLTTTLRLPNAVSRAIVEDSKTRIVEYEPIRVAYRQIRDKSRQIIRAVESNDALALQPLLHGSLLSQVNVGPKKFAEVFLSADNDKRLRKLKQAFSLFLQAIEAGVQFHGKWVSGHSEFQPLQIQLEAGLKALKDYILPQIIA